jgi:serine/threonine-protein kinase
LQRTEGNANRNSRDSAAAPAAAPVAVGTVQLAVSPWGQVEVNGTPAGIAPPLTRLTLPEGTHTITLRNDEVPPFSTTVQVNADKPVNLRHRFAP